MKSTCLHCYDGSTEQTFGVEGPILTVGLSPIRPIMTIDRIVGRRGTDRVDI